MITMHETSYEIVPFRNCELQMHRVTCSCGAVFQDTDMHEAFRQWAEHTQAWPVSEPAREIPLALVFDVALTQGDVLRLHALGVEA